MENKINELCRIPTHLFVLLKMLKEYFDFGASAEVPINTVEYYATILDSRGGDSGGGGGGSAGGRNSGVGGVSPAPMKLSKFITQNKFITRWYSDPKKSAEDLLLLLTKYKSREKAWDNKKLIG